MKKLLTICLMLLGAVAQAQNFAITATTEAAIRKNIVKGNAANYGFGMINDTLKLVGLTTRNVIFTGSTSKNDIGLGNVDNTSDLNKPVSTATQTALNLKANIASPTFTGTLTAPTIANSLGANFATSSGNVGIGTASPATNLHVNRATTSAFSLIRLETTGAGGRPYMDFKAEGVDYGYMGWRGTSNNNMFIQNYLNADLQFGTNSATRMTIRGGGNVLIGTTTDLGYKLDVNGTSIVRGTARFQSPSQSGYSELSSNSTGAIYQTNGHSYFYTNASAYDVYFQKYNSTGTNMIIKDSGSIGIGTGTPNASSILDITSTTKGVLFPRMTTTEISAISSPADGLTVYNTTLKVICFYDAGAAVWKRVSHSNM